MSSTGAGVSGSAARTGGPGARTSGFAAGARPGVFPFAESWRHRIVLLVAAVAVSGIGTPPAEGQELTPEEIAELRARVAEAARPGSEHEALMELEGEWSWTSETRMSHDADPVIARGVATARPVVEGRFLVLESELREGEGAPRVARTILGFDGRHREYTFLTMDSWGTYWVTARGPWVAEREAVVMSGRDRDPILGHTQIYDVVLTRPEPDVFTLEIIFKDEAHTRGGEPLGLVSTTYRRR